MKVSNWLSLGFALCALPAALLGCGGGGSSLPENDAASVQEWLKAKSYSGWKSEPAPVAARAPSPHGPKNRVFSNAALSANPAGKPFPKGSAAVKEIYDDAGAIKGYAYYQKLQDDSAGGMGWYYFEEVPAGMIVADGKGAEKCIGCHGAAGSDDAHLKADGAHDYVYVQVE